MAASPRATRREARWSAAARWRIRRAAWRQKKRPRRSGRSRETLRAAISSEPDVPDHEGDHDDRGDPGSVAAGAGGQGVDLPLERLDHLVGLRCDALMGGLVVASA